MPSSQPLHEANHTRDAKQTQPQTGLTVVLHRTNDSAPLAQEPVSEADLAAVASEAWRDGCLRRGMPSTPFAEVSVRLTTLTKPERAEAGCGYAVELATPNHRVSRFPHTVQSLQHVARRAAARLVAEGLLQTGDSYAYRLENSAPAAAHAAHAAPRASPATEGRPTPRTDALGLRVTMTRNPLRWLRVPLRGLLGQSTPVETVTEDEFPVFYTAGAFAQAERYARKGREVETGGVLIGSLVACEQTGEFFPVVTDVIEVEEAEQSEFTLSYTHRSWQRIQLVLRYRRDARPERAERLLGQCHGHNFPPHRERLCERCEHLAVCELTSVFVSQDDQQWHNAVFAQQPWALCHIFGLTARNEPVHRLFSLRDGRLQPRGFYLLPDFPDGP